MDENEIGKGWSFPPHFTKTESTQPGLSVYGVEMTSGQKEIESSLNVLFSTKLGQRLFRPDFGCDISDFQFKTMDNATIYRINKMIDNSLRQYETRITIKNLDVDYSSILEGKLKISLGYTINDEDSDDNLVYHYLFEDNI